MLKTQEHIDLIGRLGTVTVKERHKPKIENGRCCWVCGRPGGCGFTTALRLAGYNVPKDTIAYAHNKCMQRAQTTHKRNALR